VCSQEVAATTKKHNRKTERLQAIGLSIYLYIYRLQSSTTGCSGIPSFVFLGISLLFLIKPTRIAIANRKKEEKKKKTRKKLKKIRHSPIYFLFPKKILI